MTDLRCGDCKHWRKEREAFHTEEVSYAHCVQVNVRPTWGPTQYMPCEPHHYACPKWDERPLAASGTEEAPRPPRRPWFAPVVVRIADIRPRCCDRECRNLIDKTTGACAACGAIHILPEAAQP